MNPKATSTRAEQQPSLEPCLKLARDLRFRIVLSAVVAAFMSLFFWLINTPAVLSPDSVNSWKEAVEGVFHTVKPPFLAIFQSLFLSFFNGNVFKALSAFSLVQGFLLWFSLLVFVAVFVPNRSLWRASFALTILLFPLWPYTNVHWTDVWVVIFTVLAFSCFQLAQAQVRAFVFWLSLGFVMSVLMLATRHNSVTALPVFIGWIFVCLSSWWRAKSDRQILRSSLPPVHSWSGRLSILAFSTVVMLVALQLSKLFLWWPGVVITPPLTAASVINQYLGVLVHTPGPKQTQLIAQEEPVFDGRLGVGKLQKSIAAYHPAYQHDLLWGIPGQSEAVLPFDLLLREGDFLPKQFIALVQKSPEGFLRHKLQYLKWQLHRTSEMAAYVDGIVNEGRDLQVPFQPILASWHQAVYNVLESLRLSWPHRHWGMIFLVVLITVVLSGNLGAPAWLLVAFAAFYGGPYLLLEPGVEWRYLMPAYVTQYLALLVLFERISGGVDAASLSSTE